MIRRAGGWGGRGRIALKRLRSSYYLSTYSTRPPPPYLHCTGSEPFEGGIQNVASAHAHLYAFLPPADGCTDAVLPPDFSPHAALGPYVFLQIWAHSLSGAGAAAKEKRAGQ